jgi:serine/threonine-protein kinase
MRAEPVSRRGKAEPVALDAYKIIAHLELGRAYETRPEFALAVAEFLEARKLSGNSPESLASLAHCYAISGETTEARALLRKLKELATTRYVSAAYDLGLLHCGLGELDEALAWLNRAYEIRDGWIICITVDPRLQALHHDARFEHIVQRVGLRIQET